MSPKGLEDEGQERAAPTVEMRCDRCGDVYTTHLGATTICPECGSTSATAV